LQNLHASIHCWKNIQIIIEKSNFFCWLVLMLLLTFPHQLPTNVLVFYSIREWSFFLKNKFLIEL
jgi:hypothetical protein